MSDVYATDAALGRPSDLWLPDVEQRPSTHYNLRPDACEVDLLVIHNISLPPGEFGGDAIAQFFTGQLDCRQHPFFQQIAGVRVAAHLLIRRDGHTLQFVPLNKRAWHAGQSCFQGRENCNDFSVGIELEGTDDTPYTEVQYQVLAERTRQIQGFFPGITQARITGHSDIAPGRKTDPGPAFDWVRYQSALNAP